MSSTPVAGANDVRPSSSPPIASGYSSQKQSLLSKLIHSNFGGGLEYYDKSKKWVSVWLVLHLDAWTIKRRSSDRCLPKEKSRWRGAKRLSLMRRGEVYISEKKSDCGRVLEVRCGLINDEDRGNVLQFRAESEVDAKWWKWAFEQKVWSWQRILEASRSKSSCPSRPSSVLRIDQSYLHEPQAATSKGVRARFSHMFHQSFGWFVELSTPSRDVLLAVKDVSTNLGHGLSWIPFVAPALQVVALATKVASMSVEVREQAKELSDLIKEIVEIVTKALDRACSLGDEGHLKTLVEYMSPFETSVKEFEAYILKRRAHKSAMEMSGNGLSKTLDRLRSHGETLSQLRINKLESLHQNVEFRINAIESVIHHVEPGDAQIVALAALQPPPKPRHLLLEMENSDRPEFKIKRKLLDHEGSSIVSAQGIGGAGKSCVCLGVAKDTEIRHKFEDRIFWIQCNEAITFDEILRLVAYVCIALGCHSSAVKRVLISDGNFDLKLRKLSSIALSEVSEMPFLLIVDNVWNRTALKPFLGVIGDMGSVLISTRMRSLAIESGADLVSVYTLTNTLAVRLLEKWSGRVVAKYEETLANKLILLCGHLAIAIKIAGATLRKRHREWNLVIGDVEGRLTTLPKYCLGNDISPYETIDAMIAASVEALPAEGLKVAFLELAVVGKTPRISFEALEKIWGRKRRGVVKTAEALVDAGLCNFGWIGKQRFLPIHDVVKKYVNDHMPEEMRGRVHKRVIDNYSIAEFGGEADAERSSGTPQYRKWWRVPRDSYFEHNICRHLEACERIVELMRLVSSPEWRAYQINAGDYATHSADTQRAIECAKSKNDGMLPEIQRDLAQIYVFRYDGSRLQNIEEAIKCCEKAFGAWTRDRHPDDWAMTMNVMGIAYYRRIKGDKRSNVEEALKCERRVLELQTKEAEASCWASAMGNMGLAYWNRIDGDKRDNIEEALRCYHGALEVWASEVDLSNWAMTMGSVGLAYCNRVDGDKRDNIEEALRCYRCALKVQTKEADPSNWAMTMMSMGLAYTNRIYGDKRDNIEEALQCQHSALEVWTKEADPTNWAMTMGSMGLTYGNRIEGDKRDNVEEALRCYHGALEVWTKETDPSRWASAIGNMGLAYGNRIEGNKRDSIEEALRCYHGALEVWTKEANPSNWPMTMVNVGLAYWNRIEGDKRDNIEEALRSYHGALEVWTKEADPSNWAMTMVNMGLAYWTRIHGSKRDNIEEAIACYRCALEVQTKEADPSNWAMAMGNLGLAYWNRIDGSKRDNIEEAIKCYRSALEVFAKDTDSSYWVIVMSALGSAYWNRADGNKRTDVKEAMKCYKFVLKAQTKDGSLENLATTMTSTELAYFGQADGEKRCTIKKAFEHYRSALEVWAKDASPSTMAVATNKMGTPHKDCNVGDRVMNTERAIKLYNRALEVLMKEEFVTLWLTVLQNR